MQLFQPVGTAILSTGVPVASPIKHLDSMDAVSNFLLTLKHLEHTFYLAAPQKYLVQGFITVEYTHSGYGCFRQMGMHEASHVDFMECAGFGRDG